MVTAPTLYGSPLCQREDGVPQKNSVGIEVIEYPSINCIPQKFFPKPVAKTESPPAPPVDTGPWASIRETRERKLLYDPSSVKTIGTGKISVAIMRSFAQADDGGIGPSYRHRSQILQLVISCNDRTWGQKSYQHFTDEMGKGRVTSASSESIESPVLQPISFESSFPYIVAQKLCAN